MNPTISISCIVIGILSVGIIMAVPVVRDERGILGLVGSAAGAANSLLVSKETNRAACEYYGYIDPEFRRGASTAEQGLLLGGATAAIQALAPEETKRAGCITQGWYHPERNTVYQSLG